MTTAPSMLNVDYAEMRQIARDFTEREIVPIADEIDRSDSALPETLLRELAKMGYFGIHLPEEWGGSGMNVRSIAIVTEELCRGLLSAGSVLGRNLLMGDLLWHEGTDDQQARYLKKVATGEIQTAWAGTEPEAGSDAGNVQCQAVKKGSEYRLTGTKTFCTFASRANVIFVFARTDNTAAPRYRGISCFLVEKGPDRFQPPTLQGSHIPCVGYHGLKSYMLYLDDHPVPEENLLGGTPNQGFYQLMRGYELARIAFAARCVGLAQAAYEEALGYSQQRVQFGKRLSEFQVTRFKLAEMATDIEAARQLAMYAAGLKDGGQRCDREAGMAKLFASEVAVKHCAIAMQLHGGFGYASEARVQRFWRDAAMLPVGEGTNDIQKEVIAKRILEG